MCSRECSISIDQIARSKKIVNSRDYPVEYTLRPFACIARAPAQRRRKAPPIDTTKTPHLRRSPHSAAKYIPK